MTTTVIVIITKQPNRRALDHMFVQTYESKVYFLINETLGLHMEVTATKTISLLLSKLRPRNYSLYKKELFVLTLNVIPVSYQYVSTTPGVSRVRKNNQWWHTHINGTVSNNETQRM